jgi:hypothetical protein
MKIDYAYPIPVFSQETDDGRIFYLTIPYWLFMLIGTVIVLNVTLWSCYGLYAWVTVIL